MEPMTLEQAKDKVAQERGFKKWMDLWNETSIEQEQFFRQRANDLRLEANTAKLQEEISELNGIAIGKAKEVSEAMLVIDKYQQQVKLLTEALEKVDKIAGAWEDVNCIVREALSIINK